MKHQPAQTAEAFIYSDVGSPSRLQESTSVSSVKIADIGADLQFQKNPQPAPSPMLRPGEWMGVPEHYWMNKPKEVDPNGLAPNVPGAKLDAGKVRPAMVLGNFARALDAVSKIGTDGARKYCDGGWIEVSDGINRYDNAGFRHRLERWKGHIYDVDSKSLHLAHEAWNILAQLELTLREMENGKPTGGA